MPACITYNISAPSYVIFLRIALSRYSSDSLSLIGGRPGAKLQSANNINKESGGSSAIPAEV
jgi:hypothetical protein